METTVWLVLGVSIALGAAVAALAFSLLSYFKSTNTAGTLSAGRVLHAASTRVCQIMSPDEYSLMTDSVNPRAGVAYRVQKFLVEVSENGKPAEWRTLYNYGDEGYVTPFFTEYAPIQGSEVEGHFVTTMNEFFAFLDPKYMLRLEAVVGVNQIHGQHCMVTSAYTEAVKVTNWALAVDTMVRDVATYRYLFVADGRVVPRGTEGAPSAGSAYFDGHTVVFSDMGAHAADPAHTFDTAVARRDDPAAREFYAGWVCPEGAWDIQAYLTAEGSAAFQTSAAALAGVKAHVSAKAAKAPTPFSGAYPVRAPEQVNALLRERIGAAAQATAAHLAKATGRPAQATDVRVAVYGSQLRGISRSGHPDVDLRVYHPEFAAMGALDRMAAARAIEAALPFAADVFALTDAPTGPLVF